MGIWGFLLQWGFLVGILEEFKVDKEVEFWSVL
jgi:hypothetical protein